MRYSRAMPKMNPQKSANRPRLVKLTVSVRPDHFDALRREARRRPRKLDVSAFVRDALDIAYPPGPGVFF